jgi:exosortase A
MTDIPHHWKAALTALGSVIAALLILFHRDAGDMARIWWDVSTYNHAIFILPIIGWLVWQRWGEVKAFYPTPSWIALAGVAGAGLLWVLGEAGGIALFRHAALVMMIQSAIVTILGFQASRALLFPIFYLIFLIPVGDELVPFLQTITADMCMFFLGLVGIPAHIDGVFITTPVGLFEVAEACSGVKFLIAMVAYSALVANVCFSSWKRRILFLLMAIIVPVIANGLRAFGTIWVSELTGSVEFAASVDHIIFGWVFFALVMILVMAIGWKWFDRKPDDLWIANLTPNAPASATFWKPSAAVAALVLTLFGGQAVLVSLGQKPLNRQITLPDVSGWTRTEIKQSFPWSPRFDGADHFVSGQYVNPKGERVDLVIVLYAAQRDGKEMVGYAQGAFDPETAWSWTKDLAGPSEAKSVRIIAPGVARDVTSFYWIGGSLTGSASRVKFLSLKTRLTGADQGGAAILVSAEDSKATPSAEAISAFLKSLGAVDALADDKIAQAGGAS